VLFWLLFFVRGHVRRGVGGVGQLKWKRRQIYGKIMTELWENNRHMESQEGILVGGRNRVKELGVPNRCIVLY